MYKTKQYYERDKQYYIDKAKGRRQQTREFVNQLKSVPCVDCKVMYPPYVMQFDHTEVDKVSAVATMVSNGVALSKLLTEINKCDVVCANCHAIRTHNRRAALA